MAIGFVDALTTVIPSAASTFSPSPPTGRANGNLLLLVATVSRSGSTWDLTSPPSGWTQVREFAETAEDTCVFWRSSDGTSGDTPTLTIVGSTTTNVIGQIVAYSGVDATTPFVSEDQAVEASTVTTHTGASLTNTDAGAWGVFVAAARQVATPLSWTPGSGLTERLDSDTAGANTNNCAQMWADSAGTVATGSVAYSADTSASTAQVTMWTALLKPASAGSTPVTLPDDAATGTDALTVTAAVPVTESGTGTDALTVAAAVPLTGDTATATDDLTVSVALTLTDTATGTDDLSTGSPVALGDDSATATDALTVDAVALTLADTATGADALTVTATVPLTGDTATATDALSVTVPVALSDTATATDALTVSVAVTLTDDATATDAIFQKLPRPHLPGTVTFPAASLGTAARAVDPTGTAVLAADPSGTVSLINADATAVVVTT